jgi:hypothetical protein
VTVALGLRVPDRVEVREAVWLRVPVAVLEQDCERDCVCVRESVDDCVCVGESVWLGDPLPVSVCVCVSLGVPDTDGVAEPVRLGDCVCDWLGVPVAVSDAV